MQNVEKAIGVPGGPASVTLQALFGLANETEREVARALGLNLTDYRALTVLSESGPVTVGALAVKLSATAATTTAIVGRLEMHGFVERSRSTEDRRQVRVNVTEAASGKVKELMQPLVATAAAQLDALEPAQQLVITDFLGSVVSLMEDHLRSLSAEGAR